MAHHPIHRITKNGDTAVLFVHGILGSPDHFRDLLPLLPSHWSCVNLLLPGHGGSVRDFSRATMQEWRSYVTQQIDALTATHKRILLVGHSMGTLFCIDEALRHNDQVAGLFLLATPLYPQLTFSATLQSLQVAFGIKAHTPALQAAYDSCSITHTAKLWQYVGWLPRFAELFQAARQGRAQIKELSVPTVSVHSRNDELVSRRALHYVADLPHVTTHVLPAAGHFYYPPEDQAALKVAFQSFIATHS